MRAGWSTNSIDGSPLRAVSYLAKLGYRSLAITPDRHLLNPFAVSYQDDVRVWQETLAEHAFACVIETGARHLLDPFRKHEPTLLSTTAADRQRRGDFLIAAIDLAVALQANCVSLWSGVVRDAASENELWKRLTESLKPVLDHAASREICIGFEPEPGMFIDTLSRFDELRERTGQPQVLQLTIDLGHMECMGEWPLAETLHRYAPHLVNVHLDDMRPSVHEHLPLGAGLIDFAPLFATLRAAEYTGGLHAELPRQSHRWVQEAVETATFLKQFTAGL